MLVGVLTTAVIGGAALVEKAKIQKVIEDIDYYEKAFVQFTIQFGQAPGTLTLKRCEENIEVFKKCMEFQANRASNLCSYLGDKRGQLMFAPLQLQTSGYIKTSRWNMENGIVHNKYKNYSYNYNLNSMVVHYNKNARADFHSNFNEHSEKMAKYSLFNSAGDLDYYTIPRDLKFYKQFMLLFYENHTWLTDSWSKARDGLFSPKTMEKIDKKIDDGLPRKGKIQGVKNGTISDMKQICYDRSRDEDEVKYPAKYINSNKVKQGCDLLYYLTDVSGYIY